MGMNWADLLCAERRRRSTIRGDFRAEFERDFDRAIFSTPVKRLQDKAQVFPLEPHDAVRTRLTHSLEVSSVARGLAVAVSKWLLGEGRIKHGDDRSIEAIAATCGLIHDLGNPPFGHSGEEAIRYWFEHHIGESELNDGLKVKQYVQDFLNFEGNAQSLRLVSKLQVLADFNGLNLTFGTLSASCKYTAASHEADREGADHARKKPGYFASEEAVVQEIRSRTGTGGARNPITFLVEAADDAVYSVADIEDAVKKGVVSWSAVRDALENTKAAVVDDAIHGMKNILEAGRPGVPPNLPDDIYAAAFRTSVIGIVTRAVVEEFKKHYHSIMLGQYPHELVEKCSAYPLVKALKTFGRERVYCTPSNLKLELMGREVICDLMDVFYEGVKSLPADRPPDTRRFPGKIGALLSRNYRDVFRDSMEKMQELPEHYHRFRLLTDYVCGMTDTFAKRLHAELKNG